MRRKSRYISETFRRKDDARAWALDAERQIDRGEAPKASRNAKPRTFGIEQVALVTGHKDWKMLRRYTHLKPESLHALAASRAA